MTEHDANGGPEDWVEKLLRADRATAVRDNGFVERLLEELPPRRRVRPAWITPLMTAAGVMLAIVSLGGPGATLSALQQIEVAGFIPLGALVSLAVLLVTSLWAISESK